MSESLKICLASSLTIIGGIIVYLFTRIFIDNIIEQRKIMGEIFYAAITAKEIIYIPDGELKETKNNNISNSFGRISTNLIANINILPLYSLLEFLGIVYSKDVVIESSKILNKLSIIFNSKDIDWINFFVNLSELSKLLKIDYSLIRNYYLDTMGC